MKTEVWLRGPVPGIPPLLQPVAHSLLQAGEEVSSAMIGFPDFLLWERPAGIASVGFHLQHLSGVADRLFTYARGEALNAIQLQSLNSEEEAPTRSCTSGDLVSGFINRVDQCLDQLKFTKEESLTEVRGVGRAQIPSTVIGLLVHAAEHTTRHVGQLLVTVKIVQSLGLKS